MNKKKIKINWSWGFIKQKDYWVSLIIALIVTQALVGFVFEFVGVKPSRTADWLNFILLFPFTFLFFNKFHEWLYPKKKNPLGWWE